MTTNKTQPFDEITLEPLGMMAPPSTKSLAMAASPDDDAPC